MLLVILSTGIHSASKLGNGLHALLVNPARRSMVVVGGLAQGLVDEYVVRMGGRMGGRGEDGDGGRG